MTRVAVIGVGSMGRNHARVYRELGHATLVAVSDASPATAAEVGQLMGCHGYAAHTEMLEKERPVAVSVAVPTEAHHQVVMDVLSAGSHVLVEKPIASSVEQAEELVAAAQRLDRVLMVGHIERYNPAVLELKKRLAAGQLGRVFQIHARRLGPFPQRVRDVGVVVDLATHDLDLMRYLSGSEVVRIYGETKREIHTSQEDLVAGLLRFADGTLGILEINWLTPTKIRELTVTGERGMFRADYLTQDLFFHENAEAARLEYDALRMFRGGVSEGAMTRYAFQKVEPLRQELENFVAAAAGRPAEMVTGRDGVEALKLALGLIRSSQENRALDLAPR